MLETCAIGTSPTSIESAVEHLEGLPEPTVPCFLASLERPLRVATADSTTSTQRATGRYPRTFVFLDDLIVTTVASGESAHLLELSERVDTRRTVKAELEFPYDGSSPFEHVLDGPGTRCGACHAEEEEVSPGRFASRALQPQLEQRVPVGDLALEHLACVAPETEACEHLRALFGFGEVVPTEFGGGFGELF